MTIKYPNDFFGYPQANTLPDVNITREDIIDAIKTISHKTLLVAMMNFQQIFANNSAKSQAHLLQQLYQASQKIGEIKIGLKLAIITPIYKGGSRNLPKNYRPVVLTSYLIKILQKILAKNI